MSKNTKKLYYSGGVLLTILLSGHKKFNNNKNTITETDVFVGLMGLIDKEFITNYGENIKSAVSTYKNCSSNGADYFPINNKTKVDAFLSKTENDNNSLIVDVNSFVEDYIDPNIAVRKKITASLIETISMDNFEGMDIFKKEVAHKDTSLFDLILDSLINICKYRSINKEGVNLLDEITDERSGKRVLRNELGAKYIENMKPKQYTFGYGKRGLTDLLKKVDDSSDKKIIFSQFKEYFEKAYDKYSKVKTLAFDQPQNFFDFYVCNSLSFIIRNYRNRSIYETKKITAPTISNLQALTRYLIISGTGGIGKSMMMRHLFLDAINKINEYNTIPFFVSIKDYNEKYLSIFDFICKKIMNFSNIITYEDIDTNLKLGNCTILLDGLDELNEDDRERFEIDLDEFIDAYSSNHFIISSRPHPKLSTINRFSTINIDPFNKEQAKHLISLLIFRPDEPAIKENFIEKLDKTYFTTHKEFAENPLLLTIMLMTFEEYSDLPEKMYYFYREAYTVLTKKHDATKIGYVRKLASNVTAERFSDYFAEFSAITYTEYGYDLSYDELLSVFNKMKTVKTDNKHISVDNFIEDLTLNTCLMYYEDSSYHFIHRSFQEYFCAYYFSKQKDKNLMMIAETFVKRFNAHTDMTFDMLYDMIKPKIEEYVFLPYLENLLKKCDFGNKYWDYVSEFYPYITYSHGEVEGWPIREPDSFLLSFIIKKYHITKDFEDSKMPFIDDFIDDKFAYWDINYRNDNDGADKHSLILSKYSDIDFDYRTDCDPEIVGYDFAFEVSTLLENKEKYKQMIDYMEQDDFAYKIQLSDLINLYSTLKNKYLNKRGSIFDLLDD